MSDQRCSSHSFPSLRPPRRSHACGAGAASARGPPSWPSSRRKALMLARFSAPSTSSPPASKPSFRRWRSTCWRTPLRRTRRGRPKLDPTSSCGWRSDKTKARLPVTRPTRTFPGSCAAGARHRSGCTSGAMTQTVRACSLLSVRLSQTLNDDRVHRRQFRHAIPCAFTALVCFALFSQSRTKRKVLLSDLAEPREQHRGLPQDGRARSLLRVELLWPDGRSAGTYSNSDHPWQRLAVF